MEQADPSSWIGLDNTGRDMVGLTPCPRLDDVEELPPLLTPLVRYRYPSLVSVVDEVGVVTTSIMIPQSEGQYPLPWSAGEGGRPPRRELSRPSSREYLTSSPP